jgi:nicotinate-nucleotide adenylyltransferase
MKVGLLGGSFNPAHLGHIYISKLAIKKLGLNQVWWVPTAHNPFKDKSIYKPYKTRIEQCEKLVKTHPKIYIKEFDEIYTELLIRHLKSKYKNVEFFWLMGADNLEKFHHWEGFKKIIKEIPLVIFSRENFLKKIQKTKCWKFLAASNCKIFYSRNLDISSTEIRNSGK